MALAETIFIRFETCAHNVNGRILFNGQHSGIISIILVRRANVQRLAEYTQRLGAQGGQITVVILSV